MFTFVRLRSILSTFEQPRARYVAMALAVALMAPSLVSGLALDDYKLLAQMNERDADAWPGSAPFDLFRWMDPAHNHRFMDGLGFPWWTLESAKVAFMRPVTSLTHALDHVLWPESLFWMHAQNLCWFALLLWLCAQTYTALIERRWVAGVATALFAFDPAHGVPVGWLCNRNALVAAVFGLGALLLHHRARRSGRAPLAVAAFLCFALGLLASELAVGIAGYLFAYALLLESGSLARRARSLLPYGLTAIAWSIVRHAAGYGAIDNDFYVDPIREPTAFLSALPVRWAQLVSSQASGVASDFWIMAPPDQRTALLLFALVSAAIGLWFIVPSLRADRTSRFWALGTALSALPVTAALPSDRLLVLVGVGVMPVFAQAMHDAFERVRAQSPNALSRSVSGTTRVRAVAAGALSLFHFGIEPLMLPLTALSPAMLDHSELQIDESLPATAGIGDKTVIVADVPESLVLSYLQVRRESLGEARPAQLYWLAATPEPLRFERRSPNVLRVSARSGLYVAESEASARPARAPFQPGDRVSLSQMTIDVVEVTADGRPALCDFTFAQSLESDSYLWKTWRAGRLVDFRVPGVGGAVDSAPSAPERGPRTGPGLVSRDQKGTRPPAVLAADPGAPLH